MNNIIKLVISIFLFLSYSDCFADSLKKVCFNNICIQAEVAETDLMREQGLMFRKNLPVNRGMLFVFDEPCRPSFWMKNVKFALDMIWLDRDKRIVQINKNVPTCATVCDTVDATQDCRYVLEVNAGFVDENKINVGDKLKF